MIASIWNSQFLEVEPENQEIIQVVALDGPGVQSRRSGFGKMFRCRDFREGGEIIL